MEAERKDRKELLPMKKNFFKNTKEYILYVKSLMTVKSKLI